MKLLRSYGHLIVIALLLTVGLGFSLSGNDTAALLTYGHMAVYMGLYYIINFKLN